MANFVDQIVLELVKGALGDIASFSSLVPVQFPVVDLYDGQPSNITAKDVPKTASDHVYIQGFFTSGAIFSFTLRGGYALANQGVTWRVHGEKGDIHVTSPKAALWISPADVTIKVKTIDGEKDIPVE